MTDNTRIWNPLGDNAVVGTLLVTGSIIPAQPGTVIADASTIVGDGGATPLGVVGAGSQVGQLQTNANGVKVKTRSGALGFAEVLTFSGDPNGVITADKGSILMDISAAKLWVNTTGAAVWTQVGAASGGAKMFDVALPTTTFVNGGNENDVNFGVLGQVTYAPFVSTVNEHITGISNNGAPMTAADDGKVICIANFGPNALFVNPGSVLSVASNRLTQSGGGVCSMNAGANKWFRYDGNPAVLLWRDLAGTNPAA